MSKKKVEIPEVPIPKKQVIIKEYTLSTRDTFIACTPSLIGFVLFLLAAILGYRAILTIQSPDMQAFGLVMYLVILLPKMLNMVPMPQVTYSVTEREA